MSDSRNAQIIALDAAGKTNAQIARTLRITTSAVAGVLRRHRLHDEAIMAQATTIMKKMSDNDLIQILNDGSQKKWGNQWREIAKRYRITPEIAFAVYNILIEEEE